MPLRGFLKILLSGLFALAMLFIVAVEFSVIRAPENQSNYETYEHAAKEHFQSVQAFVIRGIEWFGLLNADELIALFTGILALATILLWIATQSILRDSRHTTQQQLRAYVLVKAADLIHFGEGQKPFVHLSLRNSGQTPAWNVRIKYDVGIFPYPDCPEFYIDDVQQHGVFGPNMEYSLAVEHGVLNEVDIVSIVNGVAAIYVFGQIDYEDAFGRPQWTKFRLLYGGPLGPSPTGVMVDHHEGNDASR